MTESKEKEMAPKKNVMGSMEFTASLINTVREPLIALDQDLRVVSANRSFYDVFKVNPGRKGRDCGTAYL